MNRTAVGLSRSSTPSSRKMFSRGIALRRAAESSMRKSRAAPPLNRVDDRNKSGHDGLRDIGAQRERTSSVGWAQSPKRRRRLARQTEAGPNLARSIRLALLVSDPLAH
jgi:hypothetical protein